jgi:hypothetical protein
MKLDIVTDTELNLLHDKVDLLIEAVSLLSNNPDHVILNTKEFEQKLGVSERTQQTWRDEGLIGFSKVKGTIFYRMTDIQKMLAKHYVPARGH